MDALTRSVPARSYSRDAFTLIELLVVIAIVATLLVVSRPAYEIFSKKSIKSVVPSLTTTLRLARQHAITKRTDTWVIFPDQAIGYNGAEVMHALRSYAVVYSNKSEGAIQYLSDWRFMPEGIYFDDALASIPQGFGAGHTLLLDSVSNDDFFPFPGSSSASVEMPAIKFRPDGRAYRWNSGWAAASDILIPIINASMSVNTNTGAINSYDLTGVTNIIVRVYSKTGQLDVLYND